MTRAWYWPRTIPPSGGPPFSLSVCPRPGDRQRDPRCVRGVGDLLRAVRHGHHEPVEARVQRPLERLGDRAASARLALDVADADVAHRERGAVEARVEADPVVERGEQAEHLERRTGLDGGLREVETGAVLTAVVGAHGTGAGVDRDHRGAQFSGFAGQRGPGRVDRRLLGLQVDGGGDAQTFGVEGLFADPRRGQLAQHLGTDVPSGPVASVASTRVSDGTVGGNIWSDRSAGSRTFISTMPSST